MIPRTHPLAAVGGAFNAVFVEAEAAGQLMFYGRGAGGAPTASAVLGDLVAVARNRLAGGARPAGVDLRRPAVRPMGEAPTRYHVSLDVADRPGVLADGRAGVRRRTTSASRPSARTGTATTPTLVSSPTPRRDAALAATVDELRAMDAVRRVASVMRVEGEPSR